MSTAIIDWGAASRTVPGQLESGDRFVVVPLPRRTLVAVADGLGHGAAAAAAARIALGVVEKSPEQPIPILLQRCHDACRTSRGVAMSLASFDADANSVDWAGVGNVEGIVVRADPAAAPARVWMLLRSGVVGASMPRLNVSHVPVANGDTLIFVTDGISPRFTESVAVTENPQQLADRILVESARPADDALVLVCRYRGRVQ